MFGFFVLMNKLLNPLIAAWILNEDASPVEGYKYVWDDTATWDDTQVWKD